MFYFCSFTNLPIPEFIMRLWSCSGEPFLFFIPIGAVSLDESNAVFFTGFVWNWASIPFFRGACSESKDCLCFSKNGDLLSVLKLSRTRFGGSCSSGVIDLWYHRMPSLWNFCEGLGLGGSARHTGLAGSCLLRIPRARFNSYFEESPECFACSIWLYS